MNRDLETNYKKVKDSNKKTGENRKSCKLYDQLGQTLKHRPAFAPFYLVDTSFVVEETTNSQEDIDGDRWGRVGGGKNGETEKRRYQMTVSISYYKQILGIHIVMCIVIPPPSTKLIDK